MLAVLTVALAFTAPPPPPAQPTTRDLERINWMEFGEWVPD